MGKTRQSGGGIEGGVHRRRRGWVDDGDTQLWLNVK